MEIKKHIDFTKIFTVNPETISRQTPAILSNLLNGEWKKAENYTEFPDPLTGENFIHVPDTKSEKELQEFKKSMENCPKSGLHNPIKSPERYLLYGAVCAKAVSLLLEVK